MPRRPAWRRSRRLEVERAGRRACGEPVQSASFRGARAARRSGVLRSRRRMGRQAERRSAATSQVRGVHAFGHVRQEHGGQARTPHARAGNRQPKPRRRTRGSSRCMSRRSANVPSREPSSTQINSTSTSGAAWKTAVSRWCSAGNTLSSLKQGTTTESRVGALDAALWAESVSLLGYDAPLPRLDHPPVQTSGRTFVSTWTAKSRRMAAGVARKRSIAVRASLMAAVTSDLPTR